VAVASSVLVLVIGGLAGEIGVGVATLLMGLVVAALVASDEFRRDVWHESDAAMP
jgi:hypothetical protein